MASKKGKKAQRAGQKQQAGVARELRVGDRVRFTEDGAEGRVVSADANSVRILWDDGEEATWRRAALANKPIVLLDDEAGEPPAAPEQAVPETAEAGPHKPAESADSDAAESATPAEVLPTATDEPARESPHADAAHADVAQVDGGAAGAAAPAAEGAVAAAPQEPAAAEPKRALRKAAGEAGPKKLSALDAAAKVLEESGQPMNCQEMIEQMAQKGYWTSPGGKTPSSTLYSAVLRELQTKGEQARFVKVERGKFSFRAAR
jgi:hypothetical protein